MPSPSGIYVGMTREELDALRVIALERISKGDRVALSGAAKSSSRSFSMSAQDMLFEINYAFRLLTGTGGASVTYFDASRPC